MPAIPSAPRTDWVRRSKPLVFLACLWPVLWLTWGAVYNELGADPVHTLIHQTGWWALVMLLASLAMTPLRRWTGTTWPLRYRRMLGLYGFFYACAHLACFGVFDLQLDWALMGREILLRPYLLVGFTAWLLLIPLALTSTRAMMRRLGRRWVLLHRLVYVTAPLGVLHFAWQVKSDLSEPLWFASLLAVLLLARLWPSRKAHRAAGRPGSTA